MTWVFFFLYGPVEAALPVYVARNLRADAYGIRDCAFRDPVGNLVRINRLP